VLAALAAAAGGLVLLALLVTRAVLPAVPWSVPVALVVVDLGVAVAALSFRRRLLGAPGARPYDPLQAGRMVVLAKACSHAGAVLAGGYAGLAVALLVASDSAARRTDALLAGGAAVAGVVLVVLGLALEALLRLPPREGSAGTGAQGLPG
jgi:hypothetical protein